MGVMGLQTYMESHSTACHDVYIPDLAEKFRKENKRVPVLVVDGMSILRYLYGQLTWLNGGQYVEYKVMVELFLKKFDDCGIRLVFFFDGPTVARKRPVWIRRRMAEVENVVKIFQNLSASNKVQNCMLPKDVTFLPSSLCWITVHLIKESGKEVYFTIGECDDEIAQYAQDKNCFGILGQDTDFLIYPGGTYYLSMRNFNLDKMTTKNNNRKRLAESLGLWPQELPLLATLSGNDTVHYQDLRAFHHSICRTNHFIPFDIKFEGVSNFIRRNRRKMDDFEWLASVALRDPSKHHLIKESIESYAPKDTTSWVPDGGDWEKVMKLAMQFHIDCWNQNQIYSIISTSICQSGAILENFSEPNFILTSKLQAELRRRLYGILLYEKPLGVGEESHVVEEWVVGQELPTYVTAIFPTCFHPGLSALWGVDDSQKGNRWGLFLEALRLPPPSSSLPLALVLYTLALAYLHDLSVGIEDWEFEVLIAVSVLVRGIYSSSPSFLSRLPTDPIFSRPVQLYTIVTKLTSFLSILNSACGYPIEKENTMEYNFADGKLFHFTYNRWKGKEINHGVLCGNSATELDIFQQIHSYIFNRNM